MGNQIYKIASSNESLGYPKLYMAPPESKVKELPWATRKEAPPESNLNEPKAISVDELQKGIEIKKPYVISLPADPKGVFTVSKSSGSGITGMHVAPNEEITAYFDQYSGELISKRTIVIMDYLHNGSLTVSRFMKDIYSDGQIKYYAY